MPLLPLPLPDELLSSVIARGARENGLPSKRQIQDAFGDNRSYRSFLFGGSLKRIGLLSGKAPDLLLHEHTVFPYATTFIAATARLKLEQLALETSAHGRLNFVSSRASVGTPYRKVCPACIEQDLREFGISYWRVSHQLPLSYFCLTHHTALRESGVPLRGNANCKDLTLPHETEVRPQSTRLDQHLQMELTTRSVQALKGGFTDWSPSTYRRTALDHGFSRSGGALAARALSTEFEYFYGQDYLQSLGCFQSQRSPWPALLCSETKQFEASTTKHLLFVSFLQLYKKPQDRKLMLYKPRRRHWTDYQALDIRTSQKLEERFKSHPLLNIGLTVADALNDVGAKSLYSHHRQRLPLTTSWLERLKNKSHWRMTPMSFE